MVAFGDAKLGIVQQFPHDLGLVSDTHGGRGTGCIQQNELGIADRGKQVDSLAMTHLGIEIGACCNGNVAREAVNLFDKRDGAPGMLRDRLRRKPPGQGRDTILIMVDQKIAACHTGFWSCFYRAWKDGWQVVGKKVFDDKEVYGDSR